MAVLKIDELTYPQIEALISEGKTTLFLPVGTLEPHGLHAPVGTDNFCAEEIAWQLAEKLSLPVAPTLNYGITTGLIAYPGGQRIPKPLYGELVKCIMLDFLKMGFKRIVIINGHGGNTETISNVIKELIVDDRGNRHFVMVDWWQLSVDALKEVYGRPGGHAALDETACIMAFRPELVDQSALNPEDHTRFQPGIVSLPYPMAMLLYDEGDATPDFDVEKASKFMGMVIDKIENILLSEIELFEKSFGHKGG